MTTTIDPDSPLKISKWIPLGLTVAGFLYLAIAIALSGLGAAH